MIRLRWSRTSIAAALAIAAGGCMAVGEPLDGDPQTGGQAQSGYPAVGAILADGQPRCTGTLIATGAVLTAAHCVEGSASFTFASDASAASAAAPGSAHVVTRVIAHPQYAADPGSGARVFDLAVLLLDQQAAEEPLPFNREDAIGLTGQSAVLVGHGMNAQPDQTGQPVAPTGQKLSARVPIVSVTDQYLDFSGADPGCPGDTGGPALMDVGGQSVVVGIASWGACSSALHTTRTDVFADFVIQAVGGVVPAPPGSGPPPEGEEPPPGEGEEPPGEDPPGEPPPGEPPPQEPPPEEDFCELNGWYGDGICDDCPLPDPDCF
jgi:hypothetical protein